MKKLQKDFTTPEQSKRLLELGVPADSADCAMFPYDETFEQYELRVVPFNKVFSTYEIYNEDGTIYPGKTPCWSVGRLIRVVNVCCTDDNVKDEIAIEVMYSNKNSAQLIIEMMREYAYVMDFSKLEE